MVCKEINQTAMVDDFIIQKDLDFGALHLFIEISVLTVSLLIHLNDKALANLTDTRNEQTQNDPQMQLSQI
jgi:hypothetical protein